MNKRGACLNFIVAMVVFGPIFFIVTAIAIPSQEMCFPLMVFPAVLIWFLWMRSISAITRLASSLSDRLALYLIPFICQILLAVCLIFLIRVEYRPGIFHWYGVSSLLLALAAVAFPFWGWGLSPKDDVAERGNRYAGWAIGGAMLGLTVEMMGLAGGVARTQSLNGVLPEVSYRILNFFAVFSLFTLFILGGILVEAADLSEAITVERDGKAALRFSAFLAALGISLAPIPAQLFPVLVDAKPPQWLPPGEWEKLFVLAVGPIALLFVAIVIEQRPKAVGRLPGSPEARDFVIGLVYLGSAGIWAILSW